MSNNMYDWVDDDRRNFIGGECPHKCSYCYVKSMNYPAVKARYSGKIRLFEDEFKKPLKSKSGKPIFIGSCFDMWAREVPSDWISNVLDFCLEYPENKYLFQSKNPKRFVGLITAFSHFKNVILGTTIETDDYWSCIVDNSDTSQPYIRAYDLAKCKDFEKFVTIEPIMRFDLKQLVMIIRTAEPTWVNIGADSKRHNLPEPSWDKVQALIAELGKFTEVKCKSNLERLKK